MKLIKLNQKGASIIATDGGYTDEPSHEDVKDA
jgi:hypothetical protein